MKPLLKLVFIGIAFLGITSAGNGQEVLTFDNLPTTPPAPGEAASGYIPDGYGGLDWSDFGVINGLEVGPSYGYYTGVVSGPNVAFNEFGGTGTISNPYAFNLHSADLTAALNLNTPLEIQVEGFQGTTMAYNNTYTVNNLGPTLINFNYLSVDRVEFISSPAQQFAMDNLNVTVPLPVPEPGSMGLMLVAGLAGALVKSRRLV